MVWGVNGATGHSLPRGLTVSPVSRFSFRQPPRQPTALCSAPGAVDVPALPMPRGSGFVPGTEGRAGKRGVGELSRGDARVGFAACVCSRTGFVGPRRGRSGRMHSPVPRERPPGSPPVCPPARLSAAASSSSLALSVPPGPVGYCQSATEELVKRHACFLSPHPKTQQDILRKTATHTAPPKRNPFTKVSWVKKEFYKQGGAGGGESS